MASSLSPTALLNRVFPFLPWKVSRGHGNRNPLVNLPQSQGGAVSPNNGQVVPLGNNSYCVLPSSAQTSDPQPVVILVQHDTRDVTCPQTEGQAMPHYAWEQMPSPVPPIVNQETDANHPLYGATSRHHEVNSPRKEFTMPSVERENLQVDRFPVEPPHDVRGSVVADIPARYPELTLHTIKYIHEQLPDAKHPLPAAAVYRDESGFAMTLLEDDNAELMNKIKRHYHYLKPEEIGEQYIERWLTDERFIHTRNWPHFIWALKRGGQAQIAHQLEEYLQQFAQPSLSNWVEHPKKQTRVSDSEALTEAVTVLDVSNRDNKNEYCLFLTLESLPKKALEQFGKMLFMESGALEMAIVLKDCASMHSEPLSIMKATIRTWLADEKGDDKSWGQFLDIVERFVKEQRSLIGERAAKKLQDYYERIREIRGEPLVRPSAPTWEDIHNPFPTEEVTQDEQIHDLHPKIQETFEFVEDQQEVKGDWGTLVEVQAKGGVGPSTPISIEVLEEFGVIDALSEFDAESLNIFFESLNTVGFQCPKKPFKEDTPEYRYPYVREQLNRWLIGFPISGNKERTWKNILFSLTVSRSHQGFGRGAGNAYFASILDKCLSKAGKVLS
ncbi:hypothetical protein [Parashewanella tropica]|uniref:hypothetical protein n=1 Tax=Parashewanella tropica TaxID=2547970 RepID=UPI00105A6BF8|nr:hypothetical protein [Parashewanella tropica]